MSVVAPRPRFVFDNSYVRDLPGLYEPWPPATVPGAALLALNDDLALELGLDPDALRTPEGIAVLAGNTVPDGAEPVAQAYAGHQFGGFNPRLGDGRAILLGEVIDRHGRRRDLHLKGAGRTPFARGGDGKAAVGPMLREYVMGEAMHALGIPTTRALAVVETGERIAREMPLPGAVLTRVAASHVRVGTFQYAAAHGGPPLLRSLADHVIDRHDGAARQAENPYLALLEHVVERQASLVARWMLVGFIHGVMNTDNMTVSGETIDYGPCAFMDAYDPATVFSSIDLDGRYAYGNQPRIALWNLARLAEAMLPLFDPDTDRSVEVATGVLRSFDERFEVHWGDGMRTKLGLLDHQPGDQSLIDDLLSLMRTERVDFTSGLRSLSSLVRDAAACPAPFGGSDAFVAWSTRWQERLESSPRDRAAVAEAMDRANPIYIARNHLVEDALAAAGAADLQPFRDLLAVLAHPFDERPGLEAYTRAAPASFGRYQTFCGT